MRATKLLVQLSIYYLVLFGGAWLLIHNNPEIQSYLPIGGAEALINSGGGKSSALESVAQAHEVKTLGQSLGWMAVAILQGGIGYLQYFSEVPAILVGFHVAGATAVWALTVWLLIAGRRRLPLPESGASGDDGASGEAGESGGAGPELADRRFDDRADGEHLVDAPGDLARQGE